MSTERRARPRRRLRPAEEREFLRRLTIAVAAAAAGLNAVLFFQTWFAQMGPGEVQDTIVSAVSGLFPGSGPQAPSQLPSPSPGRGVATSGGS